MTIVPARMNDVAAVVEIERESVTAPHWPVGEYASIVRGGQEMVKRCLLVAWAGEDLVGFAVGKVIAAEAELESVAVRALARRSGVGRGLCVAVMAWALDQGATAIDLEVRAGSAGALALYAGLGFLMIGRRRDYYSAPVDDAILMRRSLEIPR